MAPNSTANQVLDELTERRQVRSLRWWVGQIKECRADWKTLHWLRFIRLYRHSPMRRAVSFWHTCTAEITH